MPTNPLWHLAIGGAIIGYRGRGLAEMFGAVLAEAVPSADPAQVALVARSLCSAMSGAVLWFDPDGVLDLRAFARMLAAMALEGITPTP